jgi:GntR family transcriptional repressor for pyruvate dehydrogenase complex
MAYRSIQKSSTPELVMREILASIESGQLKPGDKLPTERELSKMFGVGRSTIREATSVLTLLGYLKVTQGKGTFLRNDLQLDGTSGFDLSDIQSAANIVDLVEVREILECQAVRLAAERAESEDIQRIRRAVSKMKETTDDLNRFIQHDVAFHLSLARATGNRVIHEMMKHIVENIHGEYEKFMPKALFRFDHAAETAEKILSSLVDGDGDKAAELMAEHLKLVTTRLKQLIPDVKRIRKNRL